MKYLVSKEKLIKWYRKNYKRVCFELNKQKEDNKLIIESNKIACENLNKTIEKQQKEKEKLKKQLRNEIYVRDSIASLNSNLKQENEKLKEKIREYEIGRFGE